MSEDVGPESPFTIAIPDAQIATLRTKLDLTVFPDELEDAGWEYGAPLADLRRLVARWKDGYDWRAHEARINASMPQFTRDIAVDGFGKLNIHYVHQQSTVADAIPLLFVHGWPGHFLEVQKILPLLVEASPEHPSFHVVAFSLPGFGFSEAPKQKGFSLEQFAEVGHKLMLALGYNEYVTQGGDWGHFITCRVASKYGHKHCKAWHTNFPQAEFPHPTRHPLLLISHLLFSYTPFEKAGLERVDWYMKRSKGYLEEQATQPQTLGYGLADSPVGLLAWIYEKLVTWTDAYPWDDDEVLTWISIYWFSRSGPAASLRIYREVFGSGDIDRQTFRASLKPTIPMGFSMFPQELARFPKSWTRCTGKVVFEAEHDKGGHFAAYECPDALVDDLRNMFRKAGPAFGVVSGKTGYA